MPNKKMKENFVCSICKKKIVDGYSHNAAPYKERCCEVCNEWVVIPARFAMIAKKKHEEKEEK